ncbi:MAG: GntR family transcriptional regulator [Gemmataceae bacterium]
MTIRVRPDSPVPIYEQIASQIIFAVANGDLAMGDLVPSVRDLAAQVVVNPNTVARAYQELERAGVIESRRGLGMAVSEGAAKVCLERRKMIIRDRLKEALREAASAGLSPADVCRMVEDEWPRARK